MELIVKYNTRAYWLQVIRTAGEFVAPFDREPFSCMIWEAEANRDQAELFALGEALIDAGMRYAVCGGIERERWHDAIDEAFLSRNLDEPADEARFVMTSWHAGESPSEVALFLVENTDCETHRFRNFLVLQMGADRAASEELQLGIRKEARARYEEFGKTLRSALLSASV